MAKDCFDEMTAGTGARRNLVIVRCGRGSLHPGWLVNASDRNWDLWMCPYEEISLVSDLPVPPVVEGQKWTGLHALLTSERIWQTYDYVWLPDEDLEISGVAISRFFDLCLGFDAALAAPSLTEDSYFSHPLTMHNRAFLARATNFVEIMAPCFRRDVLERMLPTFAESRTGFGWGLDFAWGRLLEGRAVYIFDAVQMRHGRPVGTMRSVAEVQSARREMRSVFLKYGARRTAMTVRAWREPGIPEDLSFGRLLLVYLQGYDYLIERAPGLAQQLVADQLDSPPTGRKRVRHRSLFGGWGRRRWPQLVVRNGRKQG